MVLQKQTDKLLAAQHCKFLFGILTARRRSFFSTMAGTALRRIIASSAAAIFGPENSRASTNATNPTQPFCCDLLRLVGGLALSSVMKASAMATKRPSLTGWHAKTLSTGRVRPAISILRATQPKR